MRDLISIIKLLIFSYRFIKVFCSEKTTDVMHWNERNEKYVYTFFNSICFYLYIIIMSNTIMFTIFFLINHTF
jgi:hypothetical protein